MRSTTHLDWLAVTFQQGTEITSVFPLAALRGNFTRESVGRHGYANLWVNPDGVQVMDRGSEAQGVHAIASGSALENMRLRGVPDWVICRHVAYMQGRASRLDVALNLLDTTLTVEDFWDAWQHGKLVTPARGARRIEHYPRTGAGIYLGSRQSSIMVRIYDKALEQNVRDAGTWLRLEAELKRVRANAVMHAIGQSENERAVMNAALADGIQWPEQPILTAALADMDPVAIRLPRKITDTMGWLYTQVAPAMAKYQRAHPDEDVLTALTAAYRTALADLDQKP